MENQRIFLAIALSFAVLLVWQLFFAPAPPPPSDPATAESPSSTVAKPSGAERIAAPTAGSAVTAPAIEGRTIEVITPRYTVRIDERGAAFVSFKLKDYRSSVGADAEPLDLIDTANAGRTLKIGALNNRISGLADAIFKADVDNSVLRVDDARRSIVFAWQNDAGVEVSRTFTFDPESYVIDHAVTIRNNSSAPLDGTFYVQLYGTRTGDQRAYGFTGPSLLLDGDLTQIDPGDIEDENKFTGKILWSSIQTRYFLNTILPQSDDPITVRLAQDDDDVVINRVQQPVSLPVGYQQSLDHQIYFGPKDSRILQKVGHGLERAVDFGMFDILAKPCVWIMNQIYQVIPNYGIAIILLTIMVKILLWPLGNKSYKSMAQMKKMQPLMTELREKYKNDKRRMNEETMRLYKTYKVNPMGGCLPMVLQIPVFFALYRMLYEAIELRHAPFFGWINDLSAPDRLFNFNVDYIPFFDPPYGIPVLTLVMGGTMLLQQKMSPPAGDPTQARMMMLMPVVFTFIFINFSSGLVLYWLINNIFSIGQQYLVQKRNA